MSVGNRILEYLDRKKLSVSELAASIDAEEKELVAMLENDTIEIKTLEKLSKELRIPLYSFFTDANYEEMFDRYKVEIPYYVERLEESEKKELKDLINAMIAQIGDLKMQLHEKEITIGRYKRMIEKEL
jgi:transcriptional regulator with XRE-family HTH domain